MGLKLDMWVQFVTLCDVPFLCQVLTNLSGFHGGPWGPTRRLRPKRPIAQLWRPIQPESARLCQSKAVDPWSQAFHAQFSELWPLPNHSSSYVFECDTECLEKSHWTQRSFLNQRACVLTKIRMRMRGTVLLRSFPRASHPSTGHVYCQEKFQVVSRLPLILTNQGPLERSVSVITSVSQCSGETVVLHFPFKAWPQQWQP